jgi:hypothetical protein
MTLGDLTTHQLRDRIGSLLSAERRTIVEFLFCLAEVERRRLHLELGYASIFAYLTEGLGFPNGSAYRRMTAADLIVRFPETADYLRNGKLNLTTLTKLRGVLKAENCADLLAQAAGKSEKEIEQLVASLAPRPAQADLIVRMPTPTPDPPAATSNSEAAPSVPPPLTAAPEKKSEPPPDRVEPTSAKQHRMHVTVSQEFVDDLKKVSDLLAHKLPGGGLEEVLHECVRLAIGVIEKRRRGSEKPRATNAEPKTDGDYVPAAVRREVWRRDGGRCAFVGADGRRCGSRRRIEIHHVQPRARGGPSTVDNCEIRCSDHNHYAAELDFGREWMARASGRGS